METIISDETYLPGDKICVASSARAGYGTYVREGFIYASLCGKAKIERESNAANSNPSRSSNEHLAKLTHNQLNQTSPSLGSSLAVVSVKTLKDHSVTLPHIGSLVMAKVTSVNPRYAKCSILSVNNLIMREKFSGQINRKDIRATEKDKIEVSKSFRCGDVILVRVISLGDMNSYFLSSAENELGVVIAYSEAGHRMLPVSWNEMQCPVTMLKEYRKVAKVQPEFINYVAEKENEMRSDNLADSEEEEEQIAQAI